MADSYKRIIIDGTADGFISTIERVKETIDSLGSGRASSALGEIFEEAIKDAKNLQDVLAKIKQSVAEMKQATAGVGGHRDFNAEKEEVNSRFNYGTRFASRGTEEYDKLSNVRDQQLKAINRDEKEFQSDQEFQKEFKQAADKLVQALEKTAAKKGGEGGGGEEDGGGEGGGGYLAGLRSQRRELLQKQLNAASRREAQGYNPELSRISREMSDVQGGGGGSNWRFAGASMMSGMGVGGNALGGLLRGAGAVGLVMSVFEIMKMAFGKGLETTRAVEQSAMVAPNSLSRYGVTDRFGTDLSSGTFLGMSKKEFAEYYVNSTRNMGSSSAMSGELAYRQAKMEMAYGLDRRQISSLDRFSIRDNGNQEATQTILQFIQVAKDKKAFGIDRDDFSQFSDRINLAVTLTRGRAQTNENYDTRDAFAAMLFGQKIGGSFADRETQGQRLNTLNSAIANPSNDFQRAFVFNALQNSRMSKMSTYETFEQMENGIYDGNIEAVLGSLKIPTKKANKVQKESFLFQLQGLTGLNYQQSRTLGESLIENPTNMDLDKFKYMMDAVKDVPTDTKGRGFNDRALDARNGFDQFTGQWKDMMSDLGVKLTSLTSAVKENTHAMDKDGKGTNNVPLKPTN
jgi:hypothetical protein